MRETKTAADTGPPIDEDDGSSDPRLLCTQYNNGFDSDSLDHLDEVDAEGAVERAVDDHVGRRVDDQQDVAAEGEGRDVINMK